MSWFTFRTIVVMVLLAVALSDLMLLTTDQPSPFNGFAFTPERDIEGEQGDPGDAGSGPVGDEDPDSTGETSGSSDETSLPPEGRDRSDSRPQTAAPGRYRYRVITMTSGPDRQDTRDEGEVTIVVEDEGSSQEARVQTHRVELEDGTSPRLQRLEWQSRGLYVLSFRVGRGGVTQYECDWTPDLVELKFPLEGGAGWTASSSCATRSGDFAENEEARVAGESLYVLKGDEVFTWRITRSTTETRVHEGGTNRRQTESSDEFAPSFGMIVRSERSSADTAADGGITRESQTIELLSFSAAV